MKHKKWIAACILAAAACFLNLDMSPVKAAGDTYRGVRYRHLADSNDVVVLSVDSASASGQTRWIDTIYVPSKFGKAVGWAKQYLFTYGIADIDSSTGTRHTVTKLDTASLKQSMDNDSAKVEIYLESSLDGDTWTQVFSDTTLRTRFTSDGDSTRRNSGILHMNTMIPGDTIVGQLWRAKVLVIHDIDSTEAVLWPIRDTVWLDDFDIWGFDW